MRNTMFYQCIMRRVVLYIFIVAGVHSTAQAEVWSGTSASGRFDVAIDYQNTVALGDEHVWQIHTKDSNGVKAQIVTVDIKGGMPAHQHGFASAPEWELDEQQRLFIQSLKFHMPGEWFFELRFYDGLVWDSILFKFLVDPAGKISTHTNDVMMSNPAAHQHSMAIPWSAQERAIISSLVLPGTRHEHSTNDDIVDLGKKLFSDKGLSGNGQQSCSDCHNADRYFTSDRLSSNAVGNTDTKNPNQNVPRDVLSIVDSYSRPWLNWDGRKDQLWSHALLPLEIADELDNNRTRVALYIAKHYRKEFSNVFGTLALDTLASWPADAGPFGNETERASWKQLPGKTRQQINTLFVYVGKALSAYQSTIKSAPGPFDNFAHALTSTGHGSSHLSISAQRGLKLFIGDKGRCINCHNNSTLTNNEFERVVLGGSMVDFGRTLGAQLFLYDEFNCLSQHSDISEARCKTKVNDANKQISHGIQGAFRVPGLRGLAKTAPYMHDGRFADLKSVINHYNSAGNDVGQQNTLPELASLSEQDQLDLVEFLLSLGSDIVE